MGMLGVESAEGIWRARMWVARQAVRTARRRFGLAWAVLRGRHTMEEASAVLAHNEILRAMRGVARQGERLRRLQHVGGSAQEVDAQRVAFLAAIGVVRAMLDQKVLVRRWVFSPRDPERVP